MVQRRYTRPRLGLTLDFDPVTWDALKAFAPGGMERAAYLLIQQGLGVRVVTEGQGAPAETLPAVADVPLFRPLPAQAK